MLSLQRKTTQTRQSSLESWFRDPPPWKEARDPVSFTSNGIILITVHNLPEYCKEAKA